MMHIAGRVFFHGLKVRPVQLPAQPGCKLTERGVFLWDEAAALTQLQPYWDKLQVSTCHRTLACIMPAPSPLATLCFGRFPVWRPLHSRIPPCLSTLFIVAFQCGVRCRTSAHVSCVPILDLCRLSYTSGADTPLAADSFMLNRHSAPTRRTHSDSGVRSSSGPHVKRPSMGGSISGRTSPFMEPHAETEDEEDMAREVEALRVCPGAFQLPPPSPGGLSGTSTPFSRTSWGGSTAGGSMSIRISGSGSGKQLRAPAEVCLALDSSPESSRPASPCRPQPRHGLRRALTGLAGAPMERHRSNLSRLLSHKLLSPAALDVVDESQHEGEGRGLEKRLSHRTRSLDLRSDSMRNGNA